MIFFFKLQTHTIRKGGNRLEKIKKTDSVMKRVVGV